MSVQPVCPCWVIWWVRDLCYFERTEASRGVQAFL